MKTSPLRFFAIPAALSVALLTSTAPAATVNWDGDGGTGGSWMTANNWSTNTLPTSADTVNFKSNTSSSQPATLNTGDSATVAVLGVGGDGGTSSAGYLQVSGSLTATGAIYVGKATGGTGVIEQLTGSTVLGSSSINLGWSVGDSGTYKMNDGTLTVNGLGVGRAGNALFQQTGGIVKVASGVTAKDLTLASVFGSGSQATYDMSGGTLSAAIVDIGAAGAAEFKLSGTGSVSSSTIRVSRDSTNGTTGKLTITSGTLQNSAGFTVGAAANGVYLQSGGQVTTDSFTVGGTFASSTVQGHGLATFKGAANFQAKSLTLGTTTNAGGIGNLVLEGSVTSGGSNLTINGTSGVGYQQYSGSTLTGLIDGTGVRRIDISTSQTVKFELGSLLDVDFLAGTNAFEGTWTLMTYGSGKVTNSGLAFASGVASGWSFNVGATSLTVTYAIPEPSTVALLAAGAVFCLWRRRLNAKRSNLGLNTAG